MLLISWIAMSKPWRFLCKLEGMRRKGYGRIYSVTVSRRYTHKGARGESNTLLWLRNMGQRPERTLWHLFPRAVQSSVLIQIKELNPFNSGLDYVRSPKARKWKSEVVGFNYTKRERFSLTFKIYWVKQLI